MKWRMQREVLIHAARLTAHGLVAAGFAALGMELVRRFWGLQWPLAGWVSALAAWGAVAAVESWARIRFDPKRTLAVALLLAGVAGCAGVALTWISWRQIGWVAPGVAVPWWRLAVAVVAGLVLLRLVCWRGERVGANWLAEEGRWLLLGATVPAATWALWTPHFAGGVDARWYAYGLHDYLQQWRAGILPVWVGQGEFAFNGAVHPFRTAPAYHFIGGLLDSLTGRTLGVFAVQHLLVVTVTALGLGAAYSAWVSLAPQRRWLACLVAGIYATSPGLLAMLFAQEMYMSYMTVPLLPLLASATVRVAERREKSAMIGMAVSAAALWFCHAPVALWAWSSCLAVTGFALAARGLGWTAWAQIGVVLGLFAWLARYQFFSVGEFAPVTDREELKQLLPFAGAAVGALAAGWMLAGWRWLAGAAMVAALALIGRQQPALSVSLLVAWAVVFGGRMLMRRSPMDESSRAAWLVLGALAGVATVVAMFRLTGAQISPAAAEAVVFVRTLWPQVVEPLSAVAARGDVQPGWAVLALGLAGLLWAVIARTVTGFALAAALIGLSLLLAPIGQVSKGLWAQFPVPLLVATSGAVSYRLTPVWVALLSVAGLLALNHALERRPRSCWWIGGALAAGLAWSIFQAQWLNRRMVPITFGETQSADLLRAENAALPIYNYNFLEVPARFSHGVMDFRGESRLLHPATSEVMARPAHKEVGRLALRATAGGPNQWHSLNARLELGPNDRKVLRFVFHEPAPDGLILLSGSRFYREYILPSSGMAAAFGAAPGNSRDLVVWNSLPHPVDFDFYWVSSRVLSAAGLDFATVEILEESPSTQPVATLALSPRYRAKVNAPAEALLETPRRYIPGYQATVNTAPVDVVRLDSGQVGVPVPAGESLVEVCFAGSEGLRRAGLVSLIGWVAALGAWAWLKWRRL